jgi:hypothetical protein
MPQNSKKAYKQKAEKAKNKEPESKSRKVKAQDKKRNEERTIELGLPEVKTNQNALVMQSSFTSHTASNRPVPVSRRLALSRNPVYMERFKRHGETCLQLYFILTHHILEFQTSLLFVRFSIFIYANNDCVSFSWFVLEPIFITDYHVLCVLFLVAYTTNSCLK